MDYKKAKEIIDGPKNFSCDDLYAKGFLEAVTHAEILVKALSDLASWDESPRLNMDGTVNYSRFDEPHAARVSRDALSEYKKKMGLDEEKEKK